MQRANDMFKSMHCNMNKIFDDDFGSFGGDMMKMPKMSGFGGFNMGSIMNDMHNFDICNP